MESRDTKKKLSCDQVSWIMNSFDHLLAAEYARKSLSPRSTEALKMAVLLELMELLGYEFEDEKAAGNALSSFWEFNTLRGIH